MQSELSCHVGMMGKYFCRVCKVKGFDASDNTTPGSSGGTLANRDFSLQAQRDSSPEGSAAGHSDHSALGAGDQRTSRKKKETLDEMVKRTQRFLQVSGATSL